MILIAQILTRNKALLVRGYICWLRSNLFLMDLKRLPWASHTRPNQISHKNHLPENQQDHCPRGKVIHP